MANFNVKLKSGEVVPVSHPDDWSPQQIEDSIYKSFGNDLPAKESVATQEKPESFGQQAFRLGIRDPSIGIAQLGRGLANAPHNIASLFGLGEHVAPLAPQDFDYAKALGQEGEGSLADKAIQMAPELAAAFTLPATRLGMAGEAIGSIPRIGGITKSVLEQTIPQAAFGAAMNDKSPEIGALSAGATMAPFAAASHLAQNASPAVRMAGKTLGSLFGGYLGHKAGEEAGLGEIGSYGIGALTSALTAKLLHGKNAAIREHLQDITPEQLETAKPRIEAAERLGLSHLSPAEATLDPYMAAKQGALSKTQGGGQLMLERGEERVKSEEGSINRLLNKIHNPETDPAKIEALYKEAGKTKLSSQLIEKFKENYIVKEALKDVEKAPEFQEKLKDVPKNSIEYWNQVKRALDARVNTLNIAGDHVKSGIVKDTRKKLTNALDVAEPVYQKARNASELKLTREGIEETFNKKDTTGNSMWNLLKDKKKYNELLGNLRNVPEAQQNLEDMQLLFKDLIPTPSIRTAAHLEKTGMTQDRNDAKAWHEIVKHFLKGKSGEKEIADLITSRKWMDEVKKINQMTNGQQKAAATINLLGKAMSQGLAQTNKED